MRNLVALALLLCSLYSCRKPQQTTPTTYVSADFKAYFDYQPGTYWILYDSANYVFDSVGVYSYSDQQVTTGKMSNEQVEMNLANFYLDSSNSVPPWSLFLSDNTCSINLQDPLSSYYEPAGSELVRGMPFRLGTYQYNNNTNGAPVTWNTTLLGDYTLGTVTFHNVYLVTNTYSYGSYAADSFYFNATNGFIGIMHHTSYAEQMRLFLVRDSLVR